MADHAPLPETGGTPTAFAAASARATFVILLADMFGLGALTLPSVAARLGWIPATVALLVAATGACYSGRLFTLLAAAVPNASAFCDYGSAALGSTGTRLVYATVYTVIAFEPPIFALTCVEAVRTLAPSLSRAAAGLLVSAAVLPLAQARHLEDVAALAWVGVAGMVVAVGAAVVGLLAAADTRPIRKHRVPTELVAHGVGAAAKGAAFMDLIFATGGQVNHVRYIAGMANKRDFGTCVAATIGVMTLFYGVIGGVGYYILGSRFDFTAPVTSVLPPGPATTLANVGLLAHTILAYVININVWSDVALHLTKAKNEDDDQPTDATTAHATTSRTVWALTTTLCVAFSALVAHLVPAFSSLMAVIASMGDLAGAYALPAVFVLALAPAALRWRGEKSAARALVPVALILSVVGMGLSLQALVQDVAH